MSVRTQSLVLTATWWASMVVIGWLLAASFQDPASYELPDGSVNPFAKVGLGQLLLGFFIVLVTLFVAVGLGLSRRFGAAAAVALGAPCLWLGWELAARL